MTLPRLFSRAAAAAVLALSAGAARAEIGLPRDVSLDGHRIDNLLHFTLTAIGILFTIMVVWMLIPVFQRNTRSVYMPGGGKKTAVSVLGLAFGVFAVVDGTMLSHAFVDVNEHFWNFPMAEKTPGAVRAEVNAHQWAWDFRLAGPDGKFNTADDVLAMNELRVPVGVPVVLQLAATDVIHSFYLPNFRVKQDAVPGSVTQLWFQAQEAGEFELGCAQHCGPNHYKMRGKIVAMPRADWEAWMASASEDARRAFQADDAAGHWGWEWRKF
jgi:cytochrome c oxidase subunit 2